MSNHKFANIWLGLKDGANTSVKTYLKWDEEADGPYSGPVDPRAGRFFKFMADQDNVQKMYKTPVLGGQPWHIWNISINDPTLPLTRIKEEIDWVLAEYPGSTSLVGAWEWTGEQYGTEHAYTEVTEEQTWSELNPDYQPEEFEEDGITPRADYDPRYVLRITGDVTYDKLTGMTGTPTYPIPHAQLLKFMPDDEFGNPATEITDRNLSMGQAPRSFF